MTGRERWAGRLLLLVGVGALITSAVIGARSAAFLQVATRAAGAIARDLGPDASPIWAEAHPAVVFTTREGVRLRVQRHEGGRARVGAPIPLLYDPRDPEGSLRRDSFWGVWGGALGALWIGLTFTGLSLFGRRIGVRPDFNF